MSVTRTGVQLALATHPAPSVAVTTVAALLSAAIGRNLVGGALVSSAVLAGQLSIGWGNDWLDRDRDRRAGRVDKPLAAGQLSPHLVARSAVAALGACVVLSLLTGVLAGSLHLLAVASGWAYNLGLKATVASPLPFAVSFGLLPAFVVAAAPGSTVAPAWLVLAGALLGTGAHFANVLPDLAADQAAGVRGAGHRLGRTGCTAAAGGLLLASVAVLAVAPPGPTGAVGWSALAGTVVLGGAGFVPGRRAGSRAAFGGVLMVAVVAVVLLVLSGTRLR